MHTPPDLDFCRNVSDRNPVVAAPLTVSDCSLISDGAAALIMVSDDVAAGMPWSVRIRAASQANNFLPMSRRDLTVLHGARVAVARALDAAGLSLGDLHLAEVHDCFTITELLLCAAIGLTQEGEGARAIEDGTVLPDGSFPVNLSDGLKAKGHPVGATGVSMHVLVARQVAGEAEETQRMGAERGLIVNTGGSGVANYASMLEVGRQA